MAYLKIAWNILSSLPALWEFFKELRGEIKTQPVDVIRNSSKTVKQFKEARTKGKTGEAAKRFNDLVSGR